MRPFGRQWVDGGRGADVALLARRKERLESAVAEAGDKARAIECDVTDADSCAAASCSGKPSTASRKWSESAGALTRLLRMSA